MSLILFHYMNTHNAVLFFPKCGRSKIRTCTIGSSNRCSTIGAIRPFAESRGIEPLYRTNDNLSLASQYLTTRSTLHFAERERLEPPDLFTANCFQDSFLDQPDSLLVWVAGVEPAKPEGTGFTDRYNSPTSSHAQCGWRKIRTFNPRLNKPPLCHWAIHP